MAANTDICRYSIESGISISKAKYANRKYPFSSMEVGQSFRTADNSAEEIFRVRAAMNLWNKQHAPMKFSLRLDSQRNYRCWRIA